MGRGGRPSHRRGRARRERATRVLDALKIGRGEVATVAARRSASVQLPHARSRCGCSMRHGVRTRRPRAGAHAIRREGRRRHASCCISRSGSGRVTVLPSLAFMTNAAIGEHDHAAFAWELRAARARERRRRGHRAALRAAFALRVARARTRARRSSRPPRCCSLWALARGRALRTGRAGAHARAAAPARSPARERPLPVARGRGLEAARRRARDVPAQDRAHASRRSSTCQPGERAERLAALTDLPRRDIQHALDRRARHARRVHRGGAHAAADRREADPQAHREPHDMEAQCDAEPNQTPTAARGRGHRRGDAARNGEGRRRPGRGAAAGARPASSPAATC